MSFFDRLRRLRSAPPTFGLVLGGGGARGAYQAGVLQYVSELVPAAHFPVLTGVSAGAINAAHLGNHNGPLPEAIGTLMASWRAIRPDSVYTYEETSRMSLLWDFVRGSRSRTDGAQMPLLGGRQALLDTAPLRAYLRDQYSAIDGLLGGVRANLTSGRLQALALITTSYTTGQTVTWIQGAEIERWERPNRVSYQTALSVEHVMASTALPFLFPAIRLGEAWYGDGGVRLSHPLSPAIHLGADRVFVISTRYNRSRAEASEAGIEGYPPPAQILSILMDAVFLDAIESDALMVGRLNELVGRLSPTKRRGLRPIRLLTIRPSVNLGKLSRDFEVELPAPLQVVTRGLGTPETRSPDWLSMLLFEERFVDRMITIGYEDAHAQRQALLDFFAPER